MSSGLSQLLVAQALPLLSRLLIQASLLRMLVVGFRAPPNPDDRISGSLIASAEALFLNEVAFRVSDGWEVGMGRCVGGVTPRPALQNGTSCSVEGCGPGLSFPPLPPLPSPSPV